MDSTDIAFLVGYHSLERPVGGDAMRDLDQKQRITGDFICVYGDVVANISMEACFPHIELDGRRVRRLL